MLTATKTRLLCALVAAGALFPAALATSARAQEGPFIAYGTTIEQLEYRGSPDSNMLAWDGDFVVGTDEWKLVLQSEGEYAIEPDQFETLENQLLVRRLLTEFFDLKAGVRYDAPAGDINHEPDRPHADSRDRRRILRR
jgi:copper resistance protein B